MNYRKIIDRLKDIYGLLMIFALVMILVVLSTQVISRTFFNIAFVWVEEVARYLFVWMVLGSAVLAYDKNLFVAVDIFSKFLSKKGKFIIEFIVRLIELFFFIWVFIASIRFMGFASGQMTPAMRIPISYIYLCFPIFFSLFSIIALAKVISLIKRGP